MTCNTVGTLNSLTGDLVATTDCATSTQAIEDKLDSIGNLLALDLALVMALLAMLLVRSLWKK
jgi:hypothetical protein